MLAEESPKKEAEALSMFVKQESDSSLVKFTYTKRFALTDKE